MRIAYDQYCAAEVDRHIESTYSADALARLVDEQKRELLGDKKHDFTRWPAEQLDEYATAHVRRAVSRDVTVPTFQEYVEDARGGALS